jgi:hypothetical protein
MAAIPSEAKKGFLIVIGILAALYVGSLVIGRLPS